MDEIFFALLALGCAALVLLMPFGTYFRLRQMQREQQDGFDTLRHELSRLRSQMAAPKAPADSPVAAPVKVESDLVITPVAREPVSLGHAAPVRPIEETPPIWAARNLSRRRRACRASLRRRRRKRCIAFGTGSLSAKSTCRKACRWSMPWRASGCCGWAC